MFLSKLKNPKFFIDFTKGELRAWLYGSFGFMLLLLLCNAVTFRGFVNNDKYIIIVLFLVVVPLLNYFVVYPARYLVWLFQREIGEALLFLNLFFIFIGSVWYGATSFELSLPTFKPRSLAITYLGATIAFFLLMYLQRNSKVPFGRYWASVGNKMLLLVTPVTFVAATILPHQWYISGTPLFVFNKTAGLWSSILVLLTLVLWRMQLPTNTQQNGRILTWLVGIVVFAAPFIMMDAWLSYDSLHYTAYLGPATAVMNGRIPLQEVFSQYGQSYLIYNLGFLFLPNTYHTAALVTTFSNALYMLCGLVILRKFIRNHLVFLILGVSLPFFFWMIYHYNSNTTPSHGGLRYLPIFLVAAILVWMRPSRQFTIPSIIAIFLAWFWSFEALIYSTVIYSVFLIAHAGTSGAANLHEVVRATVYALGRLLLLFLFFVIIMFAIYLITTGSLPRYDLYVSLVLSYVGTDPFMDYTWYQPGFYAWVPVMVSYFVAICLITNQWFSSKVGHEWMPRLGTMAALGLTVSIYCIISTQTFILKPVLLPFYLLLYWAYDASVGGRKKTQLIAASELGLAPVIMLLAYLLMGVSVGNYTPKPIYGSPNSNILRLALKHNPEDFADRLQRTCSPPNVVEPGNACLKLPVDEFRLLINRWQSNDVNLLAFHPKSTTISVLFHKPHRFPLSMSYVDGFSPQLFQSILKRSHQIMYNDLKEAQTVITTKEFTKLNNLEWALLKELCSLWTLELIDETENLAVYRLIKDPKNAIGPLINLPDRPVMRRNTL